MKNFLKTLDPLLEVLSIVESPNLLEIVAVRSSSSASCPTCKKPSDRRHSTYMRKIADLPSQDCQIQIYVQTYKWFCKSSNCEKKVFSERLPWIQAYKRRTERMEKALRSIAFSTSALQGEKVCQKLGMQVSHDTLLRLIYDTAFEQKVSPFRGD